MPVQLDDQQTKTVSSQPRAWSSHSNIVILNNDRGFGKMNSTEELSKFKEISNNYYSPTLARRTLNYSYDFPDKSPKKEKKWSIGSFFRRKKKDEISDSSGSEEDGQKKGGFLGRRKRKSEKRKKLPIKSIGQFDHVVLSRNSHIFPNGNCNNSNNNGHDESGGVLSDPTGGFGNYIGRALPKPPTQINRNHHNGNEWFTSSITDNIKHDEDETNNSRASLLASGSADSFLKPNNRKGLAKLRAESRRNTLKLNNSSSDEDSQRSASSSKFRSDESLVNAQSRRSRAARTERYLRRHSKDGENPMDYLRLTKSDAENSSFNRMLSDDSNRSPSRSPLVVSSSKLKSKNSYSSLSSQSPSISGLSTIPPSHGNFNKIRVSNSVNNPSYKPPLSLNEYLNNSNTRKHFDCSQSNDHFSKQRSVSCDGNIHHQVSPVVEDITAEVMHVQFPIGRTRHRNLSMIKQPPPAPPPRDPKRLVATQYYENVRPNTYYFDGSGQGKSKSFNLNNTNNVHNKKFNSFNLCSNYRSTSEDQLVKDSSQNNNQHFPPRPSSTTPDSSSFHVQKHMNHSTTLKPTNPDDYIYLMDKKPRCRKPIFIQANQQQNNVDKNGTQKVIDFWKKKDLEDYENSKINQKSELCSNPQMFTSQSHVQTQIFLPSVVDNQIRSTATSPFIPKASTTGQDNINDIQKVVNNEITSSQLDDNEEDEEEIRNEEMKRKSANLEEALVELEAIYNSLRLGDEDLLERAEQRERDAVIAQKLLNSGKTEVYPNNHNMSRGTLSDSSFSYEPFDTVTDSSQRRKRLSKRSRTDVDRKGDDMAYRKLNKERSITDPSQSIISQVSYLLSSPAYNHQDQVNDNNKSAENRNRKKTREPDITLDDVVYRNLKYSSNALKLSQPQPLFGIPLGPITLTSNSDYLHAVIPDEDLSKQSAVFNKTTKRHKIPDIVKDDLAFRNLRKDHNKEAAALPSVSLLSLDDVKNNNNNNTPLSLEATNTSNMKKRRAVRSLSANIGSLIYQDMLINKNINNGHTDNNTLTDIADAMKIARQVLKEKENKINATRRAFMSDTDTTISNNNGDYSVSLAKDNNNSTKLTESRLNFLNSLKTPTLLQNDSLNESLKSRDSLRSDASFLLSKPPRSPKELTPIPLSPLEEKQASLNNESTFDDLLTALAVEARETSDRITNELKEICEEKMKNEKSEKVNLTKKFSEHDNELLNNGRLSNENVLIENVVDSNELISALADEEVKRIIVEPLIPESVANIVILPQDGDAEKSNTTVIAVDNNNKIETTTESDHDYENLLSDQDLTTNCIDMDKNAVDDRGCISPFEEHKAELIARFQELKKQNDDLLLTKTQDNKKSVVSNHDDDRLVEKSNSNKHKLLRNESFYDNLEVAEKSSKKNDKITAGEETCVSVFTTLLPNSNECALIESSSYNNNNNKIAVTTDVNKLLTLKNNDKTASCFCTDKNINLLSSSNTNNNLSLLESLKSPKLVLETEKLCQATSSVGEQESFQKSDSCAVDSFLLNLPATSSATPTTTALLLNSKKSDYNFNKNSGDLTQSSIGNSASSNLSCKNQSQSEIEPLRHISKQQNGDDNYDDDDKQISDWYCNPATVAVACSYGIACAHQLASLDFVAILGILFAVISFIAALIF